MKNLVNAVAGQVGLRLVSSRPPQIEHLVPEVSAVHKQEIEVARRYSMTSIARLWTLLCAVEQAAHRGIEGDVVECGVWRGGNLILADRVGRRVGRRRKIWGYDTYAGMTAPDENDRSAKTDQSAESKFRKLDKGDHNDWCYASIEEVAGNIAREAPDGDIALIKGPVEETLRDPANLPEKIAILRLDTDWYASTKVELEVLYPRLVSGGVLLIDDYGEWAGARRAVDEYFAGQNPWLHYVDPTCRLMLKP